MSYGNFQTTMFNGYLAGGVAPRFSCRYRGAHPAHRGEGYGRSTSRQATIYDQTNLDLALRSKWVWTPTGTDTVHLIFDFERRYGSSATPDYIPKGRIPRSWSIRR